MFHNCIFMLKFFNKIFFTEKNKIFFHKILPGDSEAQKMVDFIIIKTFLCY